MRQHPDVKKKSNRHPSWGSERSDIQHRLAQCEATLASIPGGLLTLDKDWRCTYLNEAAAMFLKRAPEELLGKVVWEAFPASHRARLHDEFTRAAEQKVAGNFEDFWESCERRYEWHCYPTDDGLTVLFHDTTGRRQVEETRHESEEPYRTLFESSRDGIIFTDMEGQVLRTNPHFQEMLGYTAEELHALTYQQLTPRRWHEMEAAVVRDQVVPRGYSGEYEKEYIRKDGTVFPVSIRVWVIRDEKGRPQGMWGIVRDITERKQAEDQLQEAHRRLSLHIDNSPLAVVEWDSDFHITRWAGEATKVFGWTGDEVLGKRIDELPWVYEEDLPSVQQVMEDMLSGRRPSSVSKNRNVRKDGTVIHCEWYNSAIRDASGRLASVLSQVLDVTERKRAEEALQKSEEKFAKAFRSSPIAIAVTRRSDGRILEVNEATLALLHFNRDEVLGRTTLDLGIWLDVEARAALTEGLAATGSVRDLECQLRTKDGGIVTVRISAESLDLSGESCMLSTLVDITEHKRAEAALRESEERLKRTQGIAHLGSWELDLVNNHLSWSDEVYRIFGLRPQEFEATYEAFLECIHPDDRAAVDAAYAGSLREGRATYEIEHRIVRRSTGELRVVHEKCEHVRDASGRIIRSVGMVHDITDRKHVEEALRDSEERYHRLFEEDLTGDFISTPEGEILLCNPAFARIFGFPSAQEAVETNVLDLYLDPREREALVARLREQKGIERLEAWRRRHDGELIYIVENLIAHFNEQGELYEIKGYLFDDTDRKRAAVALEESEEKYRTLFDSIDEGFCIVEMVFDDDGRPVDYRFLEINPAFEKQTGLHEAKGKLMRTLAPDHEAHWFETYGKIALTGRPARFTNEARALHRWYDVYAFPVGGQKSKKVAILFNDITERRRTEEALRDLMRTLEDKVAQRTAELQYRARQLQKLALELSETEDRERRQLAEILHDDLQQQLAAAKFHLSLLNNRARYDPTQQVMIAQVDQMLMDAIQKSRSLSHDLSPAVLYQSDLGSALDWLAGQIRTKHGLEVAVDAFGKVNVESDALKAFLYKSAQEMLFNVVKHARINRARIRVRRFRRCVCLSVSDRGRGFDPQEVRQTAGFGLFSIRERVELLGGRMKMHSIKGHGSTFHIVVPDTDEGVGSRTSVVGEEERLAADRLPTTGYRPPLRVLLADDHQIVREGLRSLLGDEPDIQVVGEAANGREAVDKAYRLQPDVVIMDVAMPLINGDDATRQIKMHLPQTRVIALSMYEEADLKEKMRRAGAESYLLKTAPAEELLAAIRGRR